MPSLRLSLESKPSLIVSGAFDGLSARLVERAGFDAVWASGFAISASMGVPDANIMTASELVRKVSELVDAVTIPVIVDCDEGYGALPSTLRLVKQLARQGVQGICIEDNFYPKINSFLEGPERLLASKEAFSAKIRAVKNCVPDVVLIARTEAIIAELGVEEAIERGLHYAELGADCIVLHSKYQTLSQFADLITAWPGVAPLIVIPTLASHVSFADFTKLGFKIVIFANQVFRASLHRMEEVLHTLQHTGIISEIEDKMVSMEHVFQLTGLDRDPHSAA